MLEFVSGDLFKSDAQAWVNAVNCVGVMGAGIALAFKRAFPDNFEAYANACENKAVRLGRMFVFERKTEEPPQFIVNFPTLHHYNDVSRIEDIEAGLKDLVRVIQTHHITSVAVPALGAGRGGLPWEAVRAQMKAHLGQLAAVRVQIYEPMATS